MDRTSSSAFVGLVAPARAGALLRIGPQPLSFSFAAPALGVWLVGQGVAHAVFSAEACGSVEWLQPPPAVPPALWAGGWGFDVERGWPGFSAERWVLPELLAWWDGRRAWLAAFGPVGSSASALRDRLAAVEEVEPVTTPTRARRVGGTSRGQWSLLHERALSELRSGAVEKVVIARTVELLAEQAIPERAVLKALEARTAKGFTFLVREGAQAFVGASPELLCDVQGRELRTEALAGTGDARALLRSQKDLREHASVVEGIRRSLEPLADSLELEPEPRPRAAGPVTHLHTPIRATVKPGVRALELARALHPTPAVCGAPRAPARAFLRDAESFSRGWYTGAVGVLGPDRLLLCVALRCALLEGARATLFAGAGIVEGSTDAAEWLETEDKTRAMTSALGVADE